MVRIEEQVPVVDHRASNRGASGEVYLPGAAVSSYIPGMNFSIAWVMVYVRQNAPMTPLLPSGPPAWPGAGVPPPPLPEPAATARCPSSRRICLEGRPGCRRAVVCSRRTRCPCSTGQYIRPPRRTWSVAELVILIRPAAALAQNFVRRGCPIQGVMTREPGRVSCMLPRAVDRRGAPPGRKLRFRTSSSLRPECCPDPGSAGPFPSTVGGLRDVVLERAPYESGLRPFRSSCLRFAYAR